MLFIKFIVIGTLKEAYLRDAVNEYEKRLHRFCKFETVQLKEFALPDNPSMAAIAAALDAEGTKIVAEIPQRAYKIAMCVEGEQLASEGLAAKIEKISALYSGEICFIIGSSHGISEKVKSICDYKMSVSKLTFPHQLIRVILLEAVYRALNIIKGTKYHK